MEKGDSFLGTGWAFPPEFSKPGKGVKMISDEEDIDNSLVVLLSTRVGERLMQPGYGCNLDVLLFEPISLSLETYISDLVSTAIYKYEPRIKPEKVRLSSSPTEGVVLITVEYTIRATNARHNLVLPFYLNESNLADSRNK